MKQFIIDAHFHIFDSNQFTVEWVKEVEILNRPILLSEFEDLRQGEGYEVIGGVHIELDTIPQQKKAENDYFTQLLKDRKDFVKAAILYANLLDPNMKDFIKDYVGIAGAAGVRHILHVPDAPPKTCLEPVFINNVKALGKMGLHFEACMRSTELLDLYELAVQCKDTLIVLNHMGLPDVSAQQDKTRKAEVDMWKEGIQQLGTLGNVVCKISGLSSADVEEIAPLVEWCIEHFGENRVMFDSNFPVCNINISFPAWTEAMIKIFENKPYRDLFFYQNAIEIYKMERHELPS
ncbi:hypothetical protein AN639_02820 [Candidatus Epulonipiscium fishelsonii]|uniref:Uncharacterized protein n=1 Tax=Candidatus Epulonipiscium fishelsonii TaxID=77094 RepID=A0ACC8XD10_9FIRM|nr:hypothetical protein AN396_05510 [Epulopiscium sp. SCG-B11WGA-EpuloA1]ONI41764.1 hypothetical protein AN639_02820 [Epulopiscium sp. SCG-B05WGA-EpuloA1]